MSNKTEPMAPGTRIGVSGGGWTPLTIVRDDDGNYFEERLSADLKSVVSTPISKEDAMAWLDEDGNN